MRFALAVAVLTASLVLALAAACPAQPHGLTKPRPEPIALTAPPIPEPQGASAPRGDDAPPPFMQRPPAKAPSARTDLTFAARPAPADFRGLAWGTPLAQVQGLAPVTKPAPLPGTFFRSDEPLRLGQAEIRSVAYYFPKGKLTGVGVLFEGQDNFFLLKDHLIELYGPGRQLGDRYGWTWNDFFIDLRMRGTAGELRYTYQP